jgi:hypothetical protein
MFGYQKSKRMMSQRLTLFAIILISFCSDTLAQNWEEYLYYDTYHHVKESDLNGPTYFYDIRDSWVVVGYFSHWDAGNVGLVLFKNGDTDTFALDGYANTEILGINNKNQIVGRAYNSSAVAVAFKAEIINRKIENAVEVVWHSSGARNKWPQKINDDGIASGSMETGTTRWLHY